MEILRLGPILADALQDRDLQTRNANAALEKLRSKEQEFHLVEQQLSDLGRQVRFLMRELEIKSDPALASVEFEDDEEPSPDSTDTDILITSHLTLFKNLPQLQAQNQKLLMITRELAAKMEAEEKQWREMAERTENDAVRRATEMINTLTDKLNNQATQLSAAKQETEIFRAMVQRQGGVGPALGERHTMDLTSDQDVPTGLAQATRLADLNSVLRDMGTNAAKLQEELNASQRDTSRLNASYAKANAEIEYLSGLFSYCYLFAL